MQIGDKVRYVNNRGVLGDAVCEVVEINNDYLRIRKESGEILRIFNDRVVVQEPSNNVETVDEESFGNIGSNQEVWAKCSKFNGKVDCKTYAIVDPNGTHYESINVYGNSRNSTIYPMKSYSSLINKLQKRGYNRITETT